MELERLEDFVRGGTEIDGVKFLGADLVRLRVAALSVATISPGPSTVK
jgi:hypothetical protein